MSSGLVWAPDPQQPLGVRARWTGAPGLHTLHWGDGTSVRVLPWQGARPHVYRQAGRYTLTAVADGEAASATVVVRASAELVVQAELAAPNRVRLHLPELDYPDWLIAWGDDTTSRHNAATAEHTYPWGHGPTRITVTDLAGQQRTSVDGPVIDVEPQPDDGLERAGFWWDHQGHGRSGVLRGGGVAPLSEVRVRWQVGAADAGESVVTADRCGNVDLPHTMVDAVLAEFDVWRSTHIDYTPLTGGGERTWYLPVHVPRAQQGIRDVVYDWDDDYPGRVYASVTGPPEAGEYRIDWGDGTEVQTVNAQEWPLRVPHVYSSDQPRTITVHTPSGDTLTQQVQTTYLCDVEYLNHRPGHVFLLWTGGMCTSSSGYAPVRVSSDEHSPLQYHCPDDRRGWQVVYVLLFTVGGAKRIAQSTALGPRRETEITVMEPVPTRHAGDEGAQRLPSPGGERVPRPRFHVGALKDDHYTGWFEVRNPSDEAVPFALVFELAAPARVAEVSSWGGTAALTDLGDGRWRIAHDRPVPAHSGTRIDITVRPCGQPRRWPSNVQVQ